MWGQRAQEHRAPVPVTPCSVTLGKLCVLCPPQEPGAQHLPQGMRLSEGGLATWKVCEENNGPSGQPHSGGWLSDFIQRTASLRAPPTAPPASLEGLPWGAQRRTHSPSSHSASSSTVPGTEQIHCPCPQAPTRVAGEPPVFSSHLPGPQPSSRTDPAPKTLATGRGLHPQRGDTQPYPPGPAACPCWARSKVYENTLIISLKLLRNKIILFFFYNLS